MKARVPPEYGAGLAFPPVPDGGFERVRGADAVAQALRTLLLTEPGERIGRPEYGCGLRRYLFAPNSLTTRTLILETVREAITRFERRIDLEDLSVEAHRDDDVRVDIRLSYQLVSPNTAARERRNLVFPFYLDARES